jgi:outer membrane protein assembly factor BamB/tetratricopeptide (TPR) repeat protein
MTGRYLPALRYALLLLLVNLAPARGDETATVVLNGESRTTALRLNEVRKRIDEKKWVEAVEGLQAILNGAGDDLVPVSPTHSIQARRLCQIQLASLPPEALQRYRQRYEAQARKKLEQAQASHDTEALRRIVDEAFLTRAAEKAIDQLGDLAFERGRFDEAEEWWRLLAPLPDRRREQVNRGFQLVYPDPSLDAARLQAKQLLARLFSGPDSTWAEELEAFARKHGEAEGTLAGRKGRFSDLLHALAEERRKEGAAPEADWTTFGGDPSRGRVIAAPDDILDRLSDLCRSGPTWRFNLQNHSLQEESSLHPAVNAAQARTLAFYPVIVGHQVLLADARYVTAYDLRTGQSSVWYDVAGLNGGVQPNLKLPAPPDLRYTLSVADDHVYVRLGEQDIGMDAANPRRDKETFLACLGLKPDAEGEHARWTVRGVTRDNALFEGAPLASGGQLWIASIHYRRDRCITSLDSFPVDDTSQPPARWRRDVCETRDLKPGEPHFRHHLLTLAGTQLIYCSHTGAVVAVDALTGRTNWGIRYPRRAVEKGDAVAPEEMSWRDLAPVLFAAGRLYVAPADSDRLLCLDPASGRTLWEREAMKVVHVLGVGRGRLIVTTDEGLRAFGATDGRDIWSIPDQGGGLTPAGRGLLIGDLVLWPTARKRDDLTTEAVVFAVRQEDGRLADDPALLHQLPAGNLAYANGCLAVTDRQTLSVFVPPWLLLHQREAEARGRPDSATALLELARAEADAGMTARADETFQRAEEKARRWPPSRRKQLLEQARRARQTALLEAAQRAARMNRWAETSTALRRAAEVPLSDRGRLYALTRAARIWENAGQIDDALQVWRSIRSDEALQSIPTIDELDRPATAGAAAEVVIARLRGEQPAPAPQPSAAGARTNSSPPSLPLLRSWHTMLAADEWVLSSSPPEGAELITGSPRGQLLCRDAATGDLRWQQQLPFVPRWTGTHSGLLIAAGEHGIAGLRRSDGELVWHNPAPAGGGPRALLDPRPPEPLSAFQLVAGRLYCLQGQHTLLALNVETGAFLWRKPAPDAFFGLAYPSGHVSSCYYAGSETLLIQMPGRAWLLDAASGRRIQEIPAPRELWTRLPLELDDRTLCVVADRGRVTLIDARTGRLAWTHVLPGGTTRSGEAPQLVGRGSLVLLATPANVGYFLQRLDRASGKALWPRPRLLTMRRLDVSTWTFDQEAVYLADDHELMALSLADGQERWNVSLSAAGSWQLRRDDAALFVYPSTAAAEARFRFRSGLGVVQWNWGPALVPEAAFGLECRDPKSGQLVQRLRFRIETPPRTTTQRRTTEAGGRSLVLQTSSYLASAEGPVVHLARSGTFIAVGGEVWGLSTAASDSAPPAGKGR